MKNRIVWEDKSDDIQIEEIKLTANTFIQKDPDLDKVLAHEMAYLEWIK